MWESYDNTPVGRAIEALEHPDGEEYPGSNDCYKKILKENGWTEEEVTEKYGPEYGSWLGDW
jgi:hypothetical protein